MRRRPGLGIMRSVLHHIAAEVVPQELAKVFRSGRSLIPGGPDSSWRTFWTEGSDPGYTGCALEPLVHFGIS
jgi:hypothetical protein